MTQLDLTLEDAVTQRARGFCGNWARHRRSHCRCKAKSPEPRHGPHSAPDRKLTPYGRTRRGRL